MTEFSLEHLIRDALDRWKEPDPHVIARRLLSKIPQPERDAILLHGLSERVALAARMQRSAHGTGHTSPNVGASRWSRYAQRVHVSGEWKMLGDCTADECDLIALEREAGAARLAAVAEQFRALAARMRAAGAVTVADLGDDVDLGVAA